MARAALKLGVREVAALAKVSPATVTRIEADQPANATTLAALRSALEAAGVKFIDQNGEGAGIRLQARVKVEVDGHVIGYAPAIPRGRFPPPEPSTGKQTKAQIDDLTFGLRWAYGQVSAILFHSRKDALRWPGVELIPEN